MKTFSVVWVTLSMLLLSFVCAADPQEDTYNANVEQAKAWANTSPQAVDVHDYCTGSACSEVDNPSAQRYYEDDAATTSAAQQQAASDSQVQAIGQAKSHRQTVDANDPVWVKATHDMDDAYEISHGKAGKYTDCTQHKQCDYQPSSRTCVVPIAAARPSCTLTPVADKVTWHSGRKTFAFVMNSSRRVSINVNASSVIYSSLHINGMTFVIEQRTDWDPKVYVNGKYVGSLRTKTAQPFSWNSWIYQFYPFDAHLHIESNPINIHLNVPNRSHISGYVNYSYGTQTMKWVNNCAPVPSYCSVGSETCTEPGGTKVINGISTTLDCWQKTRTYQCEVADTCPTDSDLYALSSGDSDTQCTPSGSAYCSIRVLGVCIANEQPLQCETKTCQIANITCGTPSFCLDGDCYDPANEKNTDFDKSAAEVAAVNEGAKGVISSDAMTGFSGKAVSCDKKPIGVANCCDGSGWGEDIDLTSCTDEEKALMKAKQKNLVHTVGSYCSKKVLGVCLEHREGDCEYPNLLDKLVSEQGKAQLGKTFGSPESPNCAGFTTNEMSQIDFSKIDLTPYYDEMESKIDLPSAHDLQVQATQH